MPTSATHARINRLLDGVQAWAHPSRRRYRRRLRELIEEARLCWKSADYGAGYLYQSCPRLGLRGFRNTAARVGQMRLGDALVGKSVLEIGCNSGFLSLALAERTNRYVAFDNNPYLIEMARLTQGEIGGADAVEFRVDTFEAYPVGERFDVVLSFANHSTWDGNMTLALEPYFAKIQRLLVPQGRLFFESHHPALESPTQVLETIKVMQTHFEVVEQRALTAGSFWDRGRTFVEARSLAAVGPSAEVTLAGAAPAPAP
jgi:SAM-dependent methyltransferase